MPIETDPIPRHRRSLRLREYDYSQAGAYFITVCTRNRESMFGDVHDGEMVLNDAGRMAEKCWHEIPTHFPYIELDEFVIMPNHVHGIIVIHDCRGTACRALTGERFGKPVAGSVPTIIRSFKSAVTKYYNASHNIAGHRIWLRNYYEHVIRGEDDLNDIRQYILGNPSRWAGDETSPAPVIHPSLNPTP